MRFCLILFALVVIAFPLGCKSSSKAAPECATAIQTACSKCGDKSAACKRITRKVENKGGASKQFCTSTLTKLQRRMRVLGSQYCPTMEKMSTLGN